MRQLGFIQLFEASRAQTVRASRLATANKVSPGGPFRVGRPSGLGWSAPCRCRWLSVSNSKREGVAGMEAEAPWC